MKSKNKKIIYGILGLFVLGVLMISLFPSNTNHDMEKEREDFILLKNKIIGEQIPQGNYKCCLEKPCTYCIEKTPGHGEGAICNCLEDVMNGKHPCGECIGEILEGHGNVFLAEYFAKAIAEETGELDAIKKIISEKYEISIEEQL